MATISEALAAALHHHRAGELQVAEQGYRQILQVDPNQVDALRLLGVIASQLGQHQAAVDFIGRALQIHPAFADGHFSLGQAFLGLGKHDDAIASFRQAISLFPNFVEAYVTLGNALVDRGATNEAIACFRRVLHLRPDDVDTLNNLGLALVDQGRPGEAIECYRRALESFPNSAKLHSNLGTALRELGKLDEAIASFRRALDFEPDFPEILNNLGNSLADAGQQDEAMACLRRAIELKPDYADPHNNLAITLRDQGKVSEAIASLQRAVDIHPDYVDAQKTLGMFLLLQGDFQRGWPAYEWRLRMRALYRPPLPQPRWDGRPLEGRTIMLWAEQGLGDTLQFIRLAALVRERGGRTILECPAPLVRLLETSGIVDRVVPVGEPLPPFDVHLSLLSLPGVLGISSIERIPANVPYLRADPELAKNWKQDLDRHPEFKVGIVWRGGRREQADLRAADRKRSISLTHFEPLARVPGVRLFSLQKGEGTKELVQWGAKWRIVDLGDRLGDFADTAAVVANLDLIVSADTSPAHLAGALGKPTWTPLAFSGCWRWLERREDSPWYPTLRLFRQQRPDEWDEVFQRMAEALRDFMAHR